jgi:ABC-type multidrug transport system ATPase subunit
MTGFAIDVEGLCKSFGSRKVIENLSLRVAEGEVCGFLGGNGSGKTTTMRLLCGLLRPDAGHGTCLGIDLLTGADEIRRHVGYMTQRFSLYGDLTVGENLEFIARLHGMPDPEEAIRATVERAGLGDRMTQLAGELSGGWKQRLALAAAVLHRPRLLLLDEPTAGVDAKARREFWDLIHEFASEGMTILVSTHYMDEAERCARVIYIANGHLVVQGTAEEVVGQAHITVMEALGDVEAAAPKLRHQKGVETATVFGRALRVTGLDAAALRGAIAAAGLGGLDWHEVPPRLDDVFIHMLNHPPPGASFGDQA